jgi:hypothetical protein
VLEQIITAIVETADAVYMLEAAMEKPVIADEGPNWEAPVVRTLHAVIRGDKAAVRGGWRELTDSLLQSPLLYVALARGGNPQRIAAARGLQRMLRRLLDCLPRLGLLRETYWLLQTSQDMELDHPVGPGAVTEFDQLFEIGCRAMVRCLVESSRDWSPKRSSAGADEPLIKLLEQLTEALLRCWLDHSRGVRLSVLEGISEQQRWNQLKRFIELYGHDLFTQEFMQLGNLRAILHEGVDAYLEALAEEGQASLRLLEDLDSRIPRKRAVEYLALILEAILEHYPEYVDYNSTTTQSDRGEMLYSLLDFLRLAVSYDRVAWNLRPIVLAHDVLVRAGHDTAAQSWREAVGERTKGMADDHGKRFARLSRKYGMRLPSIAERLGERFVRPLEIDRLRALVRAAMEELQHGLSGSAFRRLEAEIKPFLNEVFGAGFDLPLWLDGLEREVERVESGEADLGPSDPLVALPQTRLSLPEARKQMRAIVHEE